MPIDVVDKIELFMELFERHAEARAAGAPADRDGGDQSSYFLLPLPESRQELVSLAEMLASAPTFLDVCFREWQAKEDRFDVPIIRIAQFLSENAATIDQDAPRSPKLLHYVYPVV